jgi:class 3 adenylate cyclase
MTDEHGSLEKENRRLARDLSRLERNMGRLEELQDVHDRVQRALQADLDAERARTRELLLNILPAEVVARLDAGEATIADHHDAVSIVFSDLVGFTAVARTLASDELVAALNLLFSAFDALAQQIGIEKIKTIGDSYMAVAGLGEDASDHAIRAAEFGLGMIETLERLQPDLPAPFAIRVGIHTGPIVAGVIGTHKFAYDLWGDTVNVASRMESTGIAGAVHVSPATAVLLEGTFCLTPRGETPVKGAGRMATYLVERPAEIKQV